MSMPNPTSAYYYNWSAQPALTSITLDKSGTTSATPNTAGSLYISHTSDSDHVSIAARFLHSSGVSGYQSLDFLFSGIDGKALTNLAVPTNFNVADWYTAEASSSWYTDNGYINMTGMLTKVNLVSAVPEPESYLMLLAGFALVSGVVARKKKQIC
ncbi:PEP-CTERM sorting domain-containing protein [Duganella sp. BJB488]|nr:PEP-CTERM sorting domain-containing protein [Duganella sp. BJB489]RFP13103.1 PEP-CTERM sorting domain-containing protein [Duganella sp. BJB488]RFP29277.1 PEP-CTERM sorting domain-containing protein [Duganella sp. BJB480]